MRHGIGHLVSGIPAESHRRLLILALSLTETSTKLEIHSYPSAPAIAREF
jgi:hypothetical protein